MSSIAAFPAELIDQIASDLTSDDLLAFRMTCKTLNNLTRESHLDSLYRVRTIYPVPASLENLMKISQHPSGANERVRHLIMSVCSPHGDTSRYTAFNMPVAGDIGILKAVKKLSDAHNDESTGTFKNGGQAYLLTAALLSLPNICKISFKTQKTLKRHEFNLLYPSLGFKPGKRLPPTPFYTSAVRLAEVPSACQDWWKSLILAVQTSKLSKLREITGSGYAVAGDIFQAIPISAFAIKAPQFSLRILEMEIKPGTANQDWNSDFCSWLEIWGANVVELRLKGRFFESTVFCLPENQVLARVRNLRLYDFLFELENIQRFISLSGRGIKELAFEGCHFKDDKNSWFDVLKQVREECTRVQYFSLIPVNRYEEGWTDDEDEEEEYGKYVLPVLKVKGLWGLKETMCKPTMEYAEEVTECPIQPKHIGSELDTAATAEGFWDSITDKYWDNPNLILHIRSEDLMAMEEDYY
ncbi:hypothetical protein AA313_de0206520 [Arthrobotrys entomopaga]|nr:hypothetical protein AA313_de0206520 [Arthrobotrys entomopaga]